jgi:hypothetical protein
MLDILQLAVIIWNCLYMSITSVESVLFLFLGSGNTIWPIVSASDDDDDDDECEAVGGMRIGRGNRSTRRKSVPLPLCPPQIPRDLAWA